MRAIFQEAGVDLAALLTYHDGQRDVMFSAVRIGEEWFDLRGQKLTITTIAKARRA